MNYFRNSNPNIIHDSKDAIVKVENESIASTSGSSLMDKGNKAITEHQPEHQSTPPSYRYQIIAVNNVNDVKRIQMK